MIPINKFSEYRWRPMQSEHVQERRNTCRRHSTVGPWTLSWGPVVYKAADSSKTGPDNAWFVAHNPNLQFPDGRPRNTYVVAIAGTADAYDLLEDFEVRSVIDFPQWVGTDIRNKPVKATTITAGRPYITYGTGEAAHTIITYPAPPNAIGGPVVNTLYRYLLTLPSDATVIFTGHSLGGALSPTVALATKSANILRVATVLTYPTAGPPPGNDAFVDVFKASFPKISSGPDYQSWNVNFINTLDIVPKAWCIRPDLKPNQYMRQIPSLYGPITNITDRAKVEAYVGVAEEYSKISGVTYLPLDANTFTGPTPTVPATQEDFIESAIMEHVAAYETHFQIPVPPISCIALGLEDKKRKHRQ